jgi:cell division protein YceG involved in septum cleavage
MSFNSKAKFCSFVLLVACIWGLNWYYKKTHPTYVPPPPREEINITIIPGWNLRQIAADWTAKDIVKSPEELYEILGKPAYNYKALGGIEPVLSFKDETGNQSYPLLATKMHGISYEGYLLPDTYRVYKNAKPEDVLKKIFTNLEDKITPEMRAEMERQGRSLFEILTMASVVEKEAPKSDMPVVADIFWRREKKNWALQSCATVNYITGKSDPAVSAKDKESDSLFNTYKYPGLPLGPISNPSIDAIKAALYPQKNNYWYFMTGTDGQMHYASTLEEHNYNVHKYLK